jgi:hypothetical protein
MDSIIVHGPRRPKHLYLGGNGLKVRFLSFILDLLFVTLIDTLVEFRVRNKEQ